tara:strand:- start:538 stop:954 length:417 start_codon:yes stop_codon:yes gene_type:complete
MGLDLSSLEGLENLPLKKRIDAYKDEQIADALIKSNGLMYLTAERMGCCPTTIGKRVKQSPYLQEVIDICREYTLDQYEEALKEKGVQEKDLGALCFALKTIGKKRGYAEVKELNITTSTPSETLREIEGRTAEFVNE